MAFGLYLHFPFCRNKCSYCDFYKELYDAGLESRFYEALTIETELTAGQPSHVDREIATIFIGGGTPSLMNLDRLAAWFEQLRKYYHIPPGIEISLENNPDSITREKLDAFKALGITRPTFGVQSFNPDLLQLLNRKHKPVDSHRSVYLANALGFPTFGCDLIFGLPEQTSKLLAADLDEMIDLDPPHISFYQLTVEPGTKLAERVASGTLKMPDQELSLAMYRGGCQRMEEAGYVRYEVSSFAKPGHECRHNLSYWDGSDYLGLGPSAHSFMLGQRYANTSSVFEYIQSLNRGELPVVHDESGREERMVEAIMLGLRTARGIDRQLFASRYGQSVESTVNRQQFDLMVESGYIIPDDGTIRLSDEGVYIADDIIRRLVT